MMCVPLISKDQHAMGVIQMATHNVRQKFVQEDLDLLVSVASQVGLAVEIARLHEDLPRQREIQRDLEFASQIQRGMLPSVRPSIPGYEVFDYYKAWASVGGDYFDYLPLPDRRMALAVADAAGKGIPAALIMARLYSSARYALLTTSSPCEAMKLLNDEFVASGVGYRFITYLLVVLDPIAHELTIVNAGHLSPLLRRGTDTTELGRDICGLPLGVMPEQEFQETKISLDPGDMVLLFTDGITEAQDAEQHIYGRSRLARVLADGPDSPALLVQQLIRDVKEFAGGFPQSDDSCVVCLGRLPEGTAQSQ
jgi:serine phosphatase RsbU (regulator of sigma subunit)